MAPAVLEEELPLPPEAAEQVARHRSDITRVLRGEDPRLLVVVGPCSVHDPDAALAYAERLQTAAERWQGALLIVMRVYFEKPRTVAGWKGLINDPARDGSYQINRGLRLARQLLVELAKRHLPTGTEFLDTTLGQYYADAVCWGAIGARTVESQVHRELASGLSMPVGFKNRTDGNVQVAVDAIRSARLPHWFPTLTREGAPAVVGTTGNEAGHLVLRGGTGGPNYSAEHVRQTVQLLVQHSLPPHLMIDCSHANSGKDPRRQALVAGAIAEQIGAGDRAIVAVMLESHLVGGAQSPGAQPLQYGCSITDPCLSWDDTLPVLDQLAQAARARGAR